MLIPGGGDGTATGTVAQVASERPALARALDATLKPVVTTAAYSVSKDDVVPVVAVSPTPVSLNADTAAPVMKAALPVAVTSAVEAEAVEAKTPIGKSWAASTVNVRSAPGTNSSRLDTLRVGDGVEVLGRQDDGWVHVRLASGAEGWVFGQYLGEKAAAVKVVKATRREVASTRSDDRGRVVEREERAEVSRVSSKKMGRVSRKTTLFARPDRSAGRVGTISAGERIRVLGTDGGWAKIRTSDGETGWVAL